MNKFINYLGKLYPYILVLLSILIWWNVVSAKDEEYDNNYALVIVALIWSAIASLAIVFLWFIKRAFIKKYSLISALFLISSSPFSIIGYIWLYGKYVGQYFKL